MQLNLDFINTLESKYSIKVHRDLVSRVLYSTDASIYKMEPLGIVFPRHLDELDAIVTAAAQYQVPLLARGAGSSLAGQAIGEALIIDCSRHLTRILSINPEEKTATAEPGVILTAFNRAANRYGLTFGPDPATADRATLGGCIGNNASGAHSILYGMSADHLLAADVILADGSRTTFSELTIEEARQRSNHQAAFSPSENNLEAALYQFALEVHQQHAALIQAHWSRVWRRASGYNLNFLMPWSPSAPPCWDDWQNTPLPYPPIPPGKLNLAPLFAGSESTLGILRTVTLRLVPKLKNTILAIISYEGIIQACEAVPDLLQLKPAAIELIPGDLIRLARAVPAYAKQLSFIKGDPQALLVIEFAGEAADVHSKIDRLQHSLPSAHKDDLLIATTPQQQQQVWEVRKVGLGILASQPGDEKPAGFIEDLAVPVEHLGAFVREMENIMASEGVRANYYAHASAGCLHIRPILNLKEARGIAQMRSIAQQAVELTVRLGGAVSGEHGDGIARSEWLEAAFGKEILQLFRRLKDTADPHHILNPCKIIDPPPMHEHLRYEVPHRTYTWHTLLDFQRQGGLASAIELCNGAGVCRKSDGVMCPSFQATQDEFFSTRGRSNLLRTYIALPPHHPQAKPIAEAIYESLDCCLACKGCKSECPSSVDVAKLKYEFMHAYYQKHPLARKPRDFLFAFIGKLAPLGSAFAPLTNLVFRLTPVRWLNEKILGLSSKRAFPSFSHPQPIPQPPNTKSLDCLFLTDTFSHYFHPQTEQSALRALSKAGLTVQVLPIHGAGRTMISKSFLEAARNHAAQLLAAIRHFDPQGKLPVIGVEPSEIYTLKDEFLAFFPNDPYVSALAKRAWMIDEFLLRPLASGETPLQRILLCQTSVPQTNTVLLHGHCYQKAQSPADDGYPVGVAATQAMLEALGYEVKLIDCGCCGMAGAFGYEAEHYDLSMEVGEHALFPTIRSAPPDAIVCAVGTSCRSQIEDGTQRQAIHPICLLDGRM